MGRVEGFSSLCRVILELCNRHFSAYARKKLHCEGVNESAITRTCYRAGGWSARAAFRRGEGVPRHDLLSWPFEVGVRLLGVGSDYDAILGEKANADGHKRLLCSRLLGDYKTQGELTCPNGSKMFPGKFDDYR